MSKSWEYKKIGDICVVERGGSPRPIDNYITDDESGINWIKIGDTSDSMFITETAQKIIPEGMRKSRYVKPGDFLLSNSMSFGRPYILKIDGCIHDGWLVLRDEQGVFDKRFLYYYLSSKTTYKKFKSMAVGGVVNNLNSEMVRKVEVPVPSKKEQSDIAGLLDKIMNALDSRKKELQFLDNLIKSRFVEMFGMPGTDTFGWGLVTLGSVCSINPKKNQDSRLVSGTKISFVPMPAVTERGAINTNIIKEYDEVKTGFTYFAENDVLFAKITPCMENGKGAVAKGLHNGIGFGSTEFHVLRPISGKTDPHWIYTLTAFSKFRVDAASNMTGSAGQRRVPASFLANYRVSLPPLPLQEQFADFVKQVDKSKLLEWINLAKKSFDLLHERICIW